MLVAILILAAPKFTSAFPISPDGSMVIRQPENSPVLNVVDAKSGKTKRELTGFKFQPSVIEFSPDGTKLAASNSLGEVRVWTVNSGKLLFKVTDADSRRISAYIPLLFSPDSKSLVIGNLRLTTRTPAEIDAEQDKGVLSLWDTKTGKRLSEVRTSNPWPVSKFTFINKGHTLRVLSSLITDFEFPLLESKRKEWNWHFYAMSDDGSLAGGYTPEWISIWDVASQKETLRFKDPNPTPVQNLIFAPDNRSFAIIRHRTESNADTGVTYITAELWSYPEGKLLWTSPESTSNKLYFSPDGQCVFVPSMELRKVQTGEVLAKFKDTNLPILGENNHRHTLAPPPPISRRE